MKGKKILIPVLLLITLIAIGVTIWALCFRDTAPVVLAPDYAPVEEESNAQAIEDDSGEKLETEEGGGAVSLTYSNEVAIDLSDKAASLVFANPGKSVQDMVVQIVIDDTVTESLSFSTMTPTPAKKPWSIPRSLSPLRCRNN